MGWGSAPPRFEDLVGYITHCTRRASLEEARLSERDHGWRGVNLTGACQEIRRQRVTGALGFARLDSAKPPLFGEPPLAKKNRTTLYALKPIGGAAIKANA